MHVTDTFLHSADPVEVAKSLFDPMALAIVLGGTVIALILRTPLADLGRAIRALATLGRHRWRADATLEQIGALNRIAARHGVLALDRSVIRDADLADAIAAIVDGEGPDAVAARLAAAQDARADRHLAAIDVWTALAEIAPAMGMIGTLIGLVRMFMVMTDPSAIGGAMAIALLTTLYGAVLATMVGVPVAARLRRAARHEAIERARMEAPLVAFARREQPRIRREAA